ncbi:acyl-CoA dehydrogenase [Mesorhizobium sp. CAU 1732]|uniref:acyl-CoA dehydrogenase n=1 Tax=Mesorhizobium sp. CAU 1732 TaxID=3140358 RepID=UPI00326189AA
MYKAPVGDYLFLINELTAVEGTSSVRQQVDAATVEAIISHAATFYEEVLAPTNAVSDREGAQLSNGTVKVPGALASAYRAYAEAGWGGLRFPTEWGGQGLPRVLAAASVEMLNGANLTFGSGMLLCDGAIEALLACGTDEQKQTYLPKLLSGEWTGSMNLTEPQAGSDLSQIRTTAVRDGDRYRISGSKVFITFGDHDMADNIVHLVLARIKDAPTGIRGLSLFLVPKFLPGEDGKSSVANDIKVVSIEHKLGLKASPTCLLAFGDGEGAEGWLVGEENRGLEHMFVMMSAARFTVGMQGIGISEAAYQLAAAYANERVQSRTLLGGEGAPIVHHPDIRRILMTMSSQVEANRALAVQLAEWLDLAEEAEDRDRYLAWAEFLVPIHKGHATECAVEIASAGIQVHGGIGFTEDREAAQFYRDARILPIYEGTTAIQANDLIGRKIVRDGGAVARDLLGMVAKTLPALRVSRDGRLEALANPLERLVETAEGLVDFIVTTAPTDPARVYAGAVPTLRALGRLFSGWMLCRSAIAAADAISEGASDDFYDRKLTTSRFFMDWIAPVATAEMRSVMASDDQYLRTTTKAV